MLLIERKQIMTQWVDKYTPTLKVWITELKNYIILTIIAQPLKIAKSVFGVLGSKSLKINDKEAMQFRTNMFQVIKT